MEGSMTNKLFGGLDKKGNLTLNPARFLSKEKSLEILQTLKSEGTPETLILWALSRELNNLLKVINAGSSNGIWGPVKYKKLLEQASKRIKKEKIYKAYKTIAFIDSCIKGYKNQNPWLGLRELTLNF